MRFLFLFSTSTLTGQAAQSFNILRYLIKKGHNVWAIIDQNREGDLCKQLKEAGANIFKDISISNKHKIYGKYKEINQIRSIIMDMKFEFIVSSFSNDHFLASLANNYDRNKTKIIRFFHSRKIRTDPIHRHIFLKTSLFIFYDYQIYTDFHNEYNKIGERLFLFPTTVDTEFYIPKSSEDFKKEYNLQPSSFVVGYVGMFQKGRMQKELIDAFLNFKRNFENAQLLMVGSGETLYDIQKYAYRKCGKEDIIFTGFITNTDLVNAYNSMDLFLLLKGGHDTSLRMLYEAQSCGTYILTYQSYPAKRLLDITCYGSFINNVKNIELIGKSILNSKDLINNNLRYEVHKKVSKEFDISKSGETFIKICENIL